MTFFVLFNLWLYDFACTKFVWKAVRYFYCHFNAKGFTDSTRLFQVIKLSLKAYGFCTHFNATTSR
jgi:hypothetical protein